ncbi:cation:proton antiporter [Nocardioides sp. GCM10027113]|uniref:cation:proton antiporter domain-containing protein n=1 Tax=unclassified Nocardioides TaxID=2615069 RepID=UPI00361AB326
MTDLSLILLAALVAGLAATAVRLPPLVGFLVAGFALHGAGVPEPPELDTLADLGVALLLFGIGLKLDARVLARREVWLTALVHMGVTTALGLAYLAVLAVVGIGLLGGQDWHALLVIGFALAFSSTVLVVTVLEDQSSARSRYGRTAVGILVIQDIAAVAFLTVAKASPPSPWAFLLVLLLPAAWLMRRMLRQVGHDELMPLLGVALALAPGYALFEAVGLKGDLGALLIGLLLAGEPRADELSKALFSIKELLLVGFFLSIGFTGLPSSADLLLAALLLVLIPLKSLGFVALLWWQGMRHRTSVLTGSVLANYSEFGLIVIVVGASAGFVSEDWLAVVGSAVAMSFLLSVLINGRTGRLAAFAERRMPTQDVQRLHPDDRPIDVGHADAVVMGMGRVGQAVYHQLIDTYGLHVVGIESREERAAQLRAQGLDVIEGDATDTDLWHRITQAGEVDIAVLAMPFHGSNLAALRQLEASEFAGTIAAIAQYDDEAAELRERVHAVVGLYDGAGTALADGAAERASRQRGGGEPEASPDA